MCEPSAMTSCIRSLLTAECSMSSAMRRYKNCMYTVFADCRVFHVLCCEPSQRLRVCGHF